MRIATWISLVLPLVLSLCVQTAIAVTLTVDDVIDLLLAGVSEETILQAVEESESVFHLSVDDIIDLRQAGASDDLIRELMDTPWRFSGVEREVHVYHHYDWDFYDPFDFDDYTVVFINHYYDPFAYYWYPWPRFYVYYSPFWWTSAGFYYAGHWCPDWWDPWGPCVWYCDTYFGFYYYWGPSRTRIRSGRIWSRDRALVHRRIEKERAVWRHLGLQGSPPVRVREAALRRIEAGATRLRPVRNERIAKAVRRGSELAASTRTHSARISRGASRRSRTESIGTSRSRRARRSEADRPSYRRIKRRGGQGETKPRKGQAEVARSSRVNARGRERTSTGTESESHPILRNKDHGTRKRERPEEPSNPSRCRAHPRSRPRR